MAEINAITMMMAIQAIDEKMLSLEEQIRQSSPDDSELPDVHSEYVQFMKASHSLRAAYESELKPDGNLPPYETLVKSR